MDKYEKKIVEYTGFESLSDFDEDWREILLPILPSGEFQGTVKITFEYIPSLEEQEIRSPICGCEGD